MNNCVHNNDVWLKFKKCMENARKYAKNHWKKLFKTKRLIEKDTKEEQESQKRGGALIRGGAHIRDNTVIIDS